MNILLISGHGAGDIGAAGTLGGKVYREADETRRVTAALREALRGYADTTVYPTDRNAYEDYKKGTLSAVAQFPRYGYVLEIHFNALKQDTGDGKTKGVECYVTTARQGTAAETAIVENISALGLQNRGVKRKNWSVIQAAGNAGVPAALLEVCFIDDADDMRNYTAQFQEIVQAIARGVREGLGLKEDTMTYETFKEYMDQYLKELAAKAPSDWSKQDREWAESHGILQGDADGNKRYKAFVTREELAATLHRLGQKGGAS